LVAEREKLMVQKMENPLVTLLESQLVQCLDQHLAHCLDCLKGYLMGGWLANQWGQQMDCYWGDPKAQLRVQQMDPGMEHWMENYWELQLGNLLDLMMELEWVVLLGHCWQLQ
jgi:hypothetical protein